MTTEKRYACGYCHDTHEMTLGERLVMCTRCPVPCEACRIPRGAYCRANPCECRCHPPKTEETSVEAVLLKARNRIHCEAITHLFHEKQRGYHGEADKCRYGLCGEINEVLGKLRKERG